MALRKKRYTRTNLIDRVVDLENPIIDTTYDKILELIANNALRDDFFYRFPHTNYHRIHNTVSTESDDTLPLEVEYFLAKANSESTFEPVIQSEEFPNDVIEYSFNSSLWGAYEVDRTQGRVLYRKGVLDESLESLVIEARFDWRRCIYRTWGADFSALSGDVGMTDVLALYAETVDIGKENGSNDYESIATTGTFVDSKFIEFDLIASNWAHFTNELQLGEYGQNIVFRPDWNEPTNEYLVQGDFSHSKDIRSANSGFNVNVRAWVSGAWNENTGNPTGRTAITGFIHVPNVGNGQRWVNVSANQVRDILSFFGNMELAGDTFIACTMKPRITTSWWWNYFSATAVGQVRQCEFDGATTNGYFVTTEYEACVFTNCIGMNFQGFASNSAGKEHMLSNINNAGLVASAEVPEFMGIRDIAATSNVFSIAQDPVAADLIIVDQDAYAGVVVTEGITDTITRTYYYKHDIKLKAGAAGMTLNAGGNIINAAGTAYTVDEVVILREVEDNSYMIIAEM